MVPKQLNHSDTALPPAVRRWLCLAVTCLCHYGLCPWFGLGPCACAPLNIDLVMWAERHSPNQGHSPNRRKHVTARQSRRLTADGKAVPKSHGNKVANLLPEFTEVRQRKAAYPPAKSEVVLTSSHYRNQLSQLLCIPYRMTADVVVEVNVDSFQPRSPIIDPVRPLLQFPF